ncbi:proteoglycan 4-like [Homarus americanus]|uniref:proteoglycan 4-like n=1 Tax=Homarus americanus TaxID=6706 RepID=UPI001C467BE1|nr:proteoglycan 4-like [Homarus americanus]
MLLRRLWLTGLVGLLAACLAAAQDNSTAADPAAEEKPVDDKPKLTGNPQIDYLLDPNLPHELIGYDLSNYPFFNRLPKDLLDPKFNFTCDNRHDGFYASIPHMCQVYHNCLFGQRYDFLCANFTVFDQKNFICHYVSEVDCPNSEKYYSRNEELYETTTTTTVPPPPPQIIYVDRPRPSGNRPRPLGGRNRPKRPNRPRPFGKHRTTTTTAAPDYYYDDYYDDQYYDDYYNDYTNEKTTTTTTTRRPLRRRRPNRPRSGQQGDGDRQGGPFNARERQRPRINPPVPQYDEFDGPRASHLQQSNNPREQIFDDVPQDAPSGDRRRRPNRQNDSKNHQRRKKPTTTTTTTTTTEVAPDYYYDEYYDYVDDITSTTTTAAPNTRNRPRGTGSRLRLNRPERTEAPTTEAPVEEPTTITAARVNARRNPVSNRRVTQAVPADVASDPSQPERQSPQRTRPKFPRRRTQAAADEAEIIVAPGVELSDVNAPVEAAPVSEAPVARERVRLPTRRQQGGARSSGVRGQGQPPAEYSDF